MWDSRRARNVNAEIGDNFVVWHMVTTTAGFNPERFTTKNVLDARVIVVVWHPTLSVSR